MRAISPSSPNCQARHLRDLTLPQPEVVPLGRYTSHFAYFMLTYFQYNYGANGWCNRGRRNAFHSLYSSRCPVVFPLQELEEKQANLYCTRFGGSISLTRIAKPHNNKFDGRSSRPSRIYGEKCLLWHHVSVGQSYHTQSERFRERTSSPLNINAPLRLPPAMKLQSKGLMNWRNRPYPSHLADRCLGPQFALCHSVLKLIIYIYIYINLAGDFVC